MEIADDLRDGFLYPEEFIGEEVVDLDRFVFVKPLDPRILDSLNVSHTALHDDVIDPGVGQFRDGGILLEFVEVAQQVASPRFHLPCVPVLSD